MVRNILSIALHLHADYEELHGKLWLQNNFPESKAFG